MVSLAFFQNINVFFKGDKGEGGGGGGAVINTI